MWLSLITSALHFVLAATGSIAAKAKVTTHARVSDKPYEYTQEAKNNAASAAVCAREDVCTKYMYMYYCCGE